MNNKAFQRLQIALCFVLFFVALFLSLTPILSVRLSTNAVLGAKLEKIVNIAREKELADAEYEEVDAIEEKYNALSGSILGIDENGDKTEVTFSGTGIDIALNSLDIIGFVKSFIALSAVEKLEDAILQSSLKNPSYIDSQSAASDMERLTKLNKTLYDSVNPDAVTEESVNFFRLCVGSFFDTTFSYANDVISGDSEAKNAEEATYQVFILWIVDLMKIIMLLGVYIVFPISMIISCIKMLTGIYKNRDEKYFVYSRIMQNLSALFGWVGAMLGTMVLCSASLNGSGWILVAIVAVVAALNILVSRTKSYNENEKKYLNCMQICAAISIVGALAFAVFITKADMIGFYDDPALAKAIGERIATKTQVDAVLAFSYLVVMAITSIVVYFVFKGAMALLARAACMGDFSDDTSKDRSTLAISIGLFTVIVNLIFMGIFGVSMPSEQITPFILSGVGLLLALGGQILGFFYEVKKIPDLTEKEIHAVLCGHSVTENE